MTIAEDIALTIKSKCPDTFSLYAGYGMSGGGYVHFPTGCQEQETRDENGRCLRSRYKYADGSSLEYRYRKATGSYALTTRKGSE